METPQISDNTLALAAAEEKAISPLQAIRDYHRAFMWCLWQSAFNSVGSVGGIFGGIAVGWIADRIGRRGSIAIASFISIGAVFIQFFSPSHNNAMLLIVGQFIANCVIQGLGSREDRNAYRIPFALQWIFPVILLIGLPFAPESPWYLARKERDEKARMVLQVLGTKDLDLHLRQIQETIALEDHYAAQTTYVQCLRGSDRRRTIIALMVFILQQISGVIFVLGYSTYFFQLAGFATSDSFKLGVGVTAIGVFGNLSALYSVNKLGRRTLFLGGMIGCTIINFGIGFSSISDTKAARWAEAVFTLIFGLVYQGSIGPLGYVIFSEVSSAKLRSKTVGIGICVNSLCGMLANIIIPIWTWLYIPETKNRTVDELDSLFEAKISSRNFAKAEVDR
ncbi:hypothetical protein I203_108208 [Kwoniella mangroviensis CBS 8507]|uniref:hypothetical protein n=1 Tax=Kwoniella mangroviensis CBS 8507 TaxID=1296122 RepID=UPI0030328757